MSRRPNRSSTYRKPSFTACSSVTSTTSAGTSEVIDALAVFTTSKAITDAIARANSAGILFIAAAGNEGRDCDASDCSPGNTALANVITVASIGSTGQLSAFSNRGARKVHLGAPGESVLSTVPVATGGGVTSGYGIASGTSMAAPHVTGAAALYAATRPSATAAQIRSAIIGGVTATPALKGKVSTGGRLNVGKF